MNLVSEYLNRHSLKVPVVLSTATGSLFLRSKNSDKRCRWSLVSIDYVAAKYHPGTYRVITMKPIHNGLIAKGRLFDPVASNDLFWDEYESFLLDWAKDQTLQAVDNEKEVLIVAWEMFVYGGDKRLARFANREDFFNSVNIDLPLKDRHAACIQMINILCSDPNYHSLFRSWQGEMKRYINKDKYSYWLAELVNAK